MQGGTINDFIHSCRSLKRQKDWSTGLILKIEINFQSEAKPQHEMGLKVSMPISNFKAGNFSMPT
jgi:hypothetical protein